MNSEEHPLRIHRKKAGLTQERLAKAANVSCKTIGRIEQYSHFFTIRHETARRIAEALGVKVEDLFEKHQLSNTGRLPK